ncbi:hypothetical protein [Rhodohalobacter halophilus]|uniref:hypothetical protein n=1 Tax=Rhodohalobacter halophilus TaxID=1812810 RepID=UPI00083F610E|nr:hypothetical protein [Rhodohalobacter halophilus]
MPNKNFIYIFLLTFIAGCDVFNFDEEALIYPTQLEPYEMEQLTELNEQFQASNDHICSTLNRYGLTGFSDVLFEGQSSPCLNREPVRIELTEPDTLLSLAVETLVMNEGFTGVTDPDKLELSEMEPLRGCIICEGPNIDSRIIEWKFVFNSQQINELDVHDSSITVIVDGLGVNRIWGNWYNDPYIPSRANYLPDEIVEKLDGQTIEWIEDGELFEHTILADSLNIPTEKTIIPFENSENGNLELRAGWRIEVPSNQVPFGGWAVFGDKIDGRILLVDKLRKENNFGPISDSREKFVTN